MGSEGNNTSPKVNGNTHDNTQTTEERLSELRDTETESSASAVLEEKSKREAPNAPQPIDDRVIPSALPQHPDSGSVRKKRPLSTRQKMVVGIAACASLVGIAASGFFLFDTSGQSLSTSSLLNTTSQEQQSQPATPDGAAANAQQSSATDQGKGSASDEAPVADTGAAPSGSASDEAPSPTLPEGNSVSSGVEQTETPPVVSQATVTVSVSSASAGNRVSGSANPVFAPGATAYDALCATGLSVNAQSSPYGIYVSAIGGLAEKELGGSDGWLYSVNGVEPGVSCSSYVLKDGDSVLWFYSA